MTPDLIWVDLETGGFDSRKHDVLELAAIRTSGEDGRAMGHLHALVLPRDPEAPVATEEALELAHYDQERWTEDAHPLREVLTAFARLAEGAILAGHNVAFDRRFLTVASSRCNVLIPTRPAPSVDTMELAKPLKAKGRVTSVSLVNLCLHFGIEPDREAHTAASDIRRTVLLYRRLRRLYASGGGP
jgi:DNA polymerase-3 subunit epsilon